ncbi:glycosyl hydrolase family 79 C-terminal domain-containing protein [Pseudomonas profundi]|uniref:glycosyl hydrolase family 79 C-terminal domain-containing protein n=1 Tax=Pseudomonas profundi TaxID=1981513 RepID=UPI0012384D06|nr:glycosyl hydrolase family 79 C-terminal domain-containing protein [Pseudomonas profundi]
MDETGTRDLLRGQATVGASRQTGSTLQIAMSACCAMLLAGCAASGPDAPAETVGAIQQFTASPTSITAGQTTELAWELGNVQSVKLGELTATPESSAIVAPAQTTTYTLSAINAQGEPVEYEVTVNVDEGPSVLANVSIDPEQTGPRIPEGFLGLSHEWGQAQMMMGDPAIGTNPIYRQLLTNLIERSGSPLSLRIGGSSTDRTGEPAPNTVTPMAQLARDLNAAGEGVSFFMGLNMGAGVPGLAALQARTYVQEMPVGSIEALELGNQPDLFVHNDHRDSGYDFEDYMGEFRFFARQIMSNIPGGPPLMAPSMAGFAGSAPFPLVEASDFGTPLELERLLTQEHQTIGIVSQHAYNGGSSACGGDPQPGFLLQPDAVTDNREAAEPYIKVATKMAKPYRLTEMNSITCAGEPGVSDAFEATLWAADALFEYAYAGINGVNVHSNTWNTTHSWDLYGAFLFDVPEAQYQASDTEAQPPADARFPTGYALRKVLPVYYGMLFFAEVASNQAEMLPISLASDVNVKAWATRDPDTNRISLALINKDPAASGPVRVTIPGYAIGEVKRLLAPSFEAQQGITLGGQTFDGSPDGRPVGTEYRELIEAQDGTFTVAVGPASAVLLTLNR